MVRKLKKISKKDEGGTIEVIGDNARAVLRSFTARIERLEEDKSHIMEDLKEVYAEAKSQGFDTTILRKAIARRRKDRQEIQETDALLELYEGALEGAWAKADEYENQDEE